MNVFGFLSKKSYYKEFKNYHQSRKSFSWELVNLEKKLAKVADPQERETLESKVEQVKFYMETTKKMMAATRLHDQRRFQDAAKLYQEVVNTDIYYVDLVRKYLSKAKPLFF